MTQVNRCLKCKAMDMIDHALAACFMLIGIGRRVFGTK